MIFTIKGLEFIFLPMANSDDAEQIEALSLILLAVLRIEQPLFHDDFLGTVANRIEALAIGVRNRENPKADEIC